MSGGRKSNLTAVAIVFGAIALWGCTTTQEIDQTQPPYASVSDEGRDPPTPPKPDQSDDDSRGFFGSAIHFIARGLGFHVD